MRVIRAFMLGIGVGYLIWSGKGRQLVAKFESMNNERRSSISPNPNGSNTWTTAREAQPADMATDVGVSPSVTTH